MPMIKASKTKKVKAGKSKKDGKQEAKTDKESDMEKAKANAAVWELRLKVTNQSLTEYQEAYHRLSCANEQLTSQLHRAERDAIELSAHWDRHMAAKDDQIRSLEKGLRAQEILAGEEKNKLSRDINAIQDEMKKLKEREAKLEQELIDLQKTMEIAAEEHMENLHKVESKNSAEKAHLEKEMMKQCNQKIAALEKDHREATARLEDTLRAAFKEQDRLSEALNYHRKEASDLHKLTNSITKKNTSLALDKDMLELTLKKNTAQLETQKDKLSELTAKVASLEEALQFKVEELEQQKLKEARNVALVQASQVELDKLQKVLIMREKELEHIKQLASVVVKRRTQLEEFFHDALTHVKQEIAASRFHYKRTALQDYRLRFREATEGKIKFPPIRTFHKSPHSTNSVYSDMEAAATWTYPPGREVEISDLTWEQKEQVLWLLFGKMNGQKERKFTRLMTPLSDVQKKPVDGDVRK